MMTGAFTHPPLIEGLSDQDQATLQELWKVWRDKLSANELKTRYYQGNNGLKDLGIAIPPQLKSVKTVLGWPAKAVDALAVRSRFDGFVMTDGGTEAEQAVEEVFRDNDFKTLYSQAVTSELIHSCSFLTVSRGGYGEPEVIVSAYSAQNASAIWDARKKRIKCGMTITETNAKTGEVVALNLYTDTHVIECMKENGVFKAHYHVHKLNRPLMDVLVYRPSLLYPFGKSRISKAVMSITDSAVRTALRTEVAAEFFTTPQKYLLGAPEDLFEDTSKWEAYIGNIFTVTRDEMGDIPQFGQLSQMTMQPHIDYMRSLAAQFAGETGIPVSSLGVIHDNPSSAEAIYAAKEDLIIEAEDLNATNGNALKNIARMTCAILQNTTLEGLDRRLNSISAKFRNPAMPSVVSQSDAIVKQVSCMPWIGETSVALEVLGYNEEQMARMLDEKERIRAAEYLASVVSAQPDVYQMSEEEHQQAAQEAMDSQETS